MIKCFKVVACAVLTCILAAQSGAGAIGWGISYRNGANQPPSAAESVQSLAQYGAYFMGDSQKKVMYLTFDCGYENGNTAPILDTLKKHHVPAAFFIVGHYIDAAPTLVRRMADEGHLVGNHSTNHPNMTKVSQSRFADELHTLENKYQELTGRELAPFFRPPEGEYNQSVLQQAQSLGYHTTLWSVAYKDWDDKNQPSKQSAISTINGRVHNGAIVLLHAVSRTNASILDALITQWKAEGYTFAALSSLPGIAEPTVTAVPNEQTFQMNAVPVAFRAFSIAQNNYVGLRDVAAALQGTDKQFAVAYEAQTNTVRITSGQSYSPVGNELQGAANVAAIQMLPSKQTILLDDMPLALDVYSVNGVNYMKLRDIAKALDFQVQWDSAANAVIMDSTQAYMA